MSRTLNIEQTPFNSPSGGKASPNPSEGGEQFSPFGGVRWGYSLWRGQGERYNYLIFKHPPPPNYLKINTLRLILLIMSVLTPIVYLQVKRKNI